MLAVISLALVLAWPQHISDGLRASGSANPQSGQTGAGSSSATETYFVRTAPGIKLEVKDWGGIGRPVVLLAGLGDTLHVFDSFAPKLASRYHVYGITRRGFGVSSAPDPVGDNYAANSLGDDILSVLDQLRIPRPVLIGHSFAGEELSSIGSRFPDRVAGLVYLDAAYGYAFSSMHGGDFRVDTLELRRELAASLNAISSEEKRVAIDRLLEVLPLYEADLSVQKTLLANAPDTSSTEYASRQVERSTRAGQIQQAALDGERRFTELKCPVLAIFALPHDQGLPPGLERDAADARDLRVFGSLADNFQAGIPTARVVRIPHAQHAIFRSNEAEVITEIDRFISGLSDPQ
jgi:non-heme chloroperoxidase